MPAPTVTDLLTLVYSLKGRPFVRVTSKTAIVTLDLSHPFKGRPFLANNQSTNGVATDTDLLPIYDKLSTYFPGGIDLLPLADSMYISDYSTTLTDFLPIYDSESTSAPTQVKALGGIKIKVMDLVSVLGSMKIRIGTLASALGGISNNILANNLVPVTNASSISNPTQPTLILGGNVIYSNPATLPPNGLTNARCYVNFLCNSLFPDQSLSNFFNWNLDINGGQGTWRTNSITDIYTLGGTVTVFGLTGVETEKGRIKATGNYAYINGGIFGTRRLNQPVAFIYNSVLQFTTITPNQSLNIGDPSTWTTYRAAAQGIAAACGVTLNWAIQDYPLPSNSFQAGETGIEALTSLAEGVGAKLRWNGSTQYTVVYPTTSLGMYVVPDCCLIQSMSNICYLDLQTGIYNPGIYAYPNYAQATQGINLLPIANGSSGTQQLPGGYWSKPIEVVFTSGKVLKDTDTTIPIDIPFDFEDVFIRCQTPSDGNGQFVTVVPPSAPKLPGSNPTVPPPVWFLLQTGFAGQYINYNDILGVLQPQITVDWTLFPQGNADVDAGNFTLFIGITKKTQSNGNTNNNGDVAQVMGRTWLRYKFIPTCQYNITCIFSGTLPLPGMAIKATIGDYTIGANNDVIIEHVTFNNPGILTITAIQWSEISYYQYLPNQP